ncbi:MAG: serine--tRNA ligase [Armatimonadetes bacterium]|nr:serine--tRNA ligase [Armatimonadota bacterium]
MIDHRLIRENPELIREALRRRRHEFDLDRLIEVEARRRELLAVESLRAEKNRLSDEIGAAYRDGEKERAEQLKERVAELSAQIKAQEAELDEVEAEFNALMLDLPNIPREEVPEGDDDSDNVILYERGEIPKFDFDPAPHWEIAQRLGVVDFEIGVRIARSRFVTDIGMGAAMERALINFMLDTHTREHGYTEVMPPYLANSTSLIGTATLPKFEEDQFKTTDNLYLIPTAEVPLTNMHQGEILAAEDLPRHYTAYTPCFRREAGAAGQESRGLIRVHQFNKVELMKFVRPETADDELEALTLNAEEILIRLELPYRRVLLCTGDMGFQPERTYDLEVWMPGMDKYVEISSCSQYNEFQARRCNTRYRPEPEAAPVFVHTMNGSGLAVGRTFAAIMENYQQADGSVAVPEVLRPYLGGAVEIPVPM